MKKKIADSSNVKDRLSSLPERRNLKMALSAHAYVRGNTLKFYDWLQSSNGQKVPQALLSGSVEIAMSAILTDCQC